MDSVWQIRNENDAWQAMVDAIAGKIPSDLGKIEFVGWPVFEVKLRGPKYQSSLTPRVMEAFIQLQRDVFRSYARLKYGESSARRLTDEEKKALEIVIQVGEGSTDLKAKLNEVIDKISEGLVSKMEAKHYVIVLLGAALVWGGDSIVSTYLQNQKEIKQIEAQQFAQEIDLKRWEIFAAATKQTPELNEVRFDAEEFYNAVLKSAKDAESVEIAGKNIQGSTVKELVRSSRERSGEVQLNGICRILSVDSSKPEGFIVEVRFEDGRVFKARLEDAFILQKERNLAVIQDAEWSKNPIYLRMNGRELRGDITQATILEAKSVQIGEEGNPVLASD